MTRFLFALLLLASSAAAQELEKDFVRDNFEKSKVVYDDAMTKAKADYLEALDSKIREIAGTGNLEAVKALQAEKKEYEKDGKLPTSAAMKKGNADFQAAVDKARKRMAAAYDTAVSEYTKALQIEKAEAINSEYAAFKKQPGTKAVEPTTAKKSPKFEYKFYDWNAGDKPVKMIHKDDGFCYLTIINGAMNGGSEGANVGIKEDGYWYLWGSTGTGFFKLQAVAVKINSLPDKAAAIEAPAADKLKKLLTSKQWFFHWEEQPPRRDHPVHFLPNGRVESGQGGDWSIEPMLAVKHGGSYLFPIDENTFHGFFIPTGRQVGIFADQKK